MASANLEVVCSIYTGMSLPRWWTWSTHERSDALA